MINNKQQSISHFRSRWDLSLYLRRDRSLLICYKLIITESFPHVNPSLIVYEKWRLTKYIILSCRIIYIIIPVSILEGALDIMSAVMEAVATWRYPFWVALLWTFLHGTKILISSACMHLRIEHPCQDFINWECIN
jgi:hypothetical protein